MGILPGEPHYECRRRVSVKSTSHILHYHRSYQMSRTTSISDGITSNNQTNLVLKGIIGIGAMAKISSFVGKSDDEGLYDVHLFSFESVILQLTLPWKHRVMQSSIYSSGPVWHPDRTILI